MRAAHTLLNALKDDDAGVRVRAADALPRGGAAADEAVPALIELLTDGDRNVVLAAAMALGQYGPEAEAALPALGELHRRVHGDRLAMTRVAGAMRAIRRQ